MSLFLALMVIGLIGLVTMAIPGLNRHGHAAHIAHLPKISHVLPKGATPHGSHGPLGGQNASLTRFVPSPRVVFGFLALYGAFCNAFERAGHLSFGLSALAGIVPAFLIERFLLTPLWNKLMDFQGQPCSPLENLVMTEAKAVTPFRNGRGMVSVVHDGRLVQMRAELHEAQALLPVKVGDVLCVEDIDARNERVKVSVR